jgi:hypothetical protein
VGDRPQRGVVVIHSGLPQYVYGPGLLSLLHRNAELTTRTGPHRTAATLNCGKELFAYENICLRAEHRFSLVMTIQYATWGTLEISARDPVREYVPTWHGESASASVRL